MKIPPTPSRISNGEKTEASEIEGSTTPTYYAVYRLLHMELPFSCVLTAVGSQSI